MDLISMRLSYETKYRGQPLIDMLRLKKMKRHNNDNQIVQIHQFRVLNTSL